MIFFSTPNLNDRQSHLVEVKAVRLAFADIVLVMADAFDLANCPSASRGIFDHATAQARAGASVFWIRPGLLIGDTLDDFVAYWQVKRDGSRRGIVEIIL